MPNGTPDNSSFLLFQPLAIADGKITLNHRVVYALARETAPCL
jgi:hypothetical protein